MADDSLVISNNAGSDNPDYTPATDEVGGVHYQKVKLIDPTPDSTAPIGVSANPMHVQGTVTASVSGVATAANQATEITSLATIAGAVKAEDAPMTSGDPGVMMFGVRNTSGATHAGTEGDYSAVAINQFGMMYAGPTIVNMGSNDISFGILKQEDSAHASGHAGVMMLGVNNRGYAAFNSTSQDYTPIGVGDKGVVLSMLMYDSSMGGGSSAVTLEDNPLSAGQALVLVGSQREDVPTNNTSNDADAAPLKSDANGKLWTNAEITVALPAGTNAIGKLAANSGVDIGNVGHNIGGPTSFSGTVTTAGTAVRYSAASIPCKRVSIMNPASSTAILAVGGSTVSATSGSEVGWILNPGDGRSFDCSDVNQIYINADTSSARYIGDYS